MDHIFAFMAFIYDTPYIWVVAEFLTIAAIINFVIELRNGEFRIGATDFGGKIIEFLCFISALVSPFYWLSTLVKSIVFSIALDGPIFVAALAFWVIFLTTVLIPLYGVFGLWKFTIYINAFRRAA